MACFISFASFSFPISVSTPTTFFEERNPWKLALDRPLRQLYYATDTKLSTYFTDAISTLNWISRHRCLTLLRHQCEVVSRLTNVDSCTMISGYWEGPEVDDGWGFVEAFVDRIV